jgi:hypothetical protein
MAALAVALVFAYAAGAQAQNVDIAAFHGTWEGSAISESEISVHFRLTHRDIGVQMRPVANGFSLTWNTVQRQRGDPAKPREELRSTSLQFRQVRPGVWESTTNRDPLGSGEPYAWAVLERQTLAVNLLQIAADGRAELQVYRRTLRDAFMELEFSRIVDGRQMRSAKGRLVKVAE